MIDFSKYDNISKEELLEAIQNAKAQAYAVIHELGPEDFKSAVSENEFYKRDESTETGFYTGELCILYHLTQDSKFKEGIEIQLDKFQAMVNRNLHEFDLGFIFTPSALLYYKLTGNEKARKIVFDAADYISSRYSAQRGFVDSLYKEREIDGYILSVNSLMGIPLLCEATEKDYSSIAKSHVTTFINYMINPDGSVIEMLSFDENNKIKEKIAHTSYSSSTIASKNQALAAYGLAVAYERLQESSFLEAFYRVCDYFIENLTSKLIPIWDLSFDENSDEVVDTTAAAIFVCSLMEIMDKLPKDKADYYFSIAKKMKKVLCNSCSVKDYLFSNGQLLMGTYEKASGYNLCENKGVDECNVMGDYFYVEALSRFAKEY